MKEKTNIFITSHNGRIKCLLRELGWDITKEHPKSKGFYNCSVIKIFSKLTDGGSGYKLHAELVYNGNPPKNSGYLDKFNWKSKDYITENEEYSHRLLSNHDIYLIRHGKGHHNKGKLGKIRADPKLVPEGIKQAYECGKFFNKNKINGSVFFASLLHRTIQTMGIIMLVLGVENGSVINILKQNHEITKKDFEAGKCNEPYNDSLLGENRTSLFSEGDIPKKIVPVFSFKSFGSDSKKYSSVFKNNDPKSDYVGLPFYINFYPDKKYYSNNKNTDFFHNIDNIVNGVSYLKKLSEEKKQIDKMMTSIIDEKNNLLIYNPLNYRTFKAEYLKPLSEKKNDILKNIESYKIPQNGGLLEAIEHIKSKNKEKKYIDKLNKYPEMQQELIRLLEE